MLVDGKELPDTAPDGSAGFFPVFETREEAEKAYPGASIWAIEPKEETPK